MRNKNHFNFVTTAGNPCAVVVDGAIITVIEHVPGGKDQILKFLLDKPDNAWDSLEQRVSMLEAQLAGTSPSTLSRQNASLKDDLAVLTSLVNAHIDRDEPDTSIHYDATGDSLRSAFGHHAMSRAEMAREAAEGAAAQAEQIARINPADYVTPIDVASRAVRLREVIAALPSAEEIARRQERNIRRIVQDELKRKRGA